MTQRANSHQVPHVVALVAVHNRLDYTKRCLAALRASVVRCRLDIILVDDGSSDGTVEWLRDHAPDVHVLRGDGNLWFGRSLQWALVAARERYPHCDYLMTVNNDTFFRLGAVDEMAVASAGQASVGACFWLEDRQLPGSSGFVWHWWRGPQDIALSESFMRARADSVREFRPVDLLATTATLFPAAFCFRIQGIDTKRNPHNRADVDLSAQVRDCGCALLVSTHYLADHLYGSVTTRYSVRNLTVRQFWHDSFANRNGAGHLPYSLVSIWCTAPSRRRAIPVLVRRIIIFLRQLTTVLLLNAWRALQRPARGNQGGT